MASGPHRRRRGARIGVAVAIAAVLAVSFGLAQAWDEPTLVREDTVFDAFRTDGKLVLRVMTPTLY